MKNHIPALFLIAFCFTGCQPETKNIKPGKNLAGINSKKQTTQATQERQKELEKARLDEKKQALIFDLEHVTFVIEQVFGNQWKKAFQAGNAQQFKSFFYEEFSGSSIESSKFSKKTVGFLSEKTRRATEKQPKLSLDRDQMATYLSSLKKHFNKLHRVKFRVLKIMQPLPGQPIWECRILIDAVGESGGQKPTQYESEQVVIFEIPNESEIATHSVISEWRIEKEVFRDAEHYLTTEVTNETLINEIKLVDNWELDVKNTEQYWFQYSVEDFDRDGKLDFAVACNYFYPGLFYHASGNRFFRVTDERNLVAAAGKPELENHLDALGLTITTTAIQTW
ncbi:MAG: hypothetical protein VX438_01335 [Planctomycetota bacterium]|nr:hypothetical protein [Planctomycetota bacterium]